MISLAAALLLSTRELKAHNHKQLARLAQETGAIVRYSTHAVLPSECSSRLAAARVPVEHLLRRGETLAAVLRRLGVNGEAAREASTALAEHVALRSIKAGNRYLALLNPDSTLAALDLTLEGVGRVQLSRAEDPAAGPANRAGGYGEAPGSGEPAGPGAGAGHWRMDWQAVRRGTALRMVRGTLDGASPSLEAAIRRAGGPPGLAYRMAEVLQWDLDFARDLRRGDHFQVIYEAIQLDGKDRGIGNLMALAYDNQGRNHEAYRYGDAEVYYDGDGRPLKKMFLRSPLRYTHITSLFSQHRFHPVLNEVRPHYGVDYAAPVGTPVEVTASGMVVFAGWDGGGGNVVKVQHGSDFVTAYLHLSRFAPGIHSAARVRQGDTIAYTGATGLATGPHLDYRVKYRGDWVDPLTLKGLRDEPIAPTQLASFHLWRDTLRSSMDSGVVPAGLTVPGGHAETRLARLGATPADVKPATPAVAAR